MAKWSHKVRTKEACEAPTYSMRPQGVKVRSSAPMTLPPDAARAIPPSSPPRPASAALVVTAVNPAADATATYTADSRLATVAPANSQRRRQNSPKQCNSMNNAGEAIPNIEANHRPRRDAP